MVTDPGREQLWADRGVSAQAARERPAGSLGSLSVRGRCACWKADVTVSACHRRELEVPFRGVCCTRFYVVVLGTLKEAAGVRALAQARKRSRSLVSCVVPARASGLQPDRGPGLQPSQAAGVRGPCACVGAEGHRLLSRCGGRGSGRGRVWRCFQSRRRAAEGWRVWNCPAPCPQLDFVTSLPVSLGRSPWPPARKAS